MSGGDTGNSASNIGVVTQPVYVAQAADSDDTVDLIELFIVIWRRKWIVIIVTLLFAIGGVAYALLATPLYRAEATLALNDRDDEAGLTGGLGGLAELAGVNLGSSTGGASAIASLQSRVPLEGFIEENDLMPVLFADLWDSEKQAWIANDPSDWPDVRDGVKLFIDEVRAIDEDAGTGTINLSITWNDPAAAAEWVGKLVIRINEQLRSRDIAISEERLSFLEARLRQESLVELRGALSKLIENEFQALTLARAEEEYVFRVIDPPRVPKVPAYPRKTLVVIIATTLGGMIALLSALLHWSISEHKRTTTG